MVSVDGRRMHVYTLPENYTGEPDGVSILATGEIVPEAEAIAALGEFPATWKQVMPSVKDGYTEVTVLPEKREDGSTLLFTLSDDPDTGSFVLDAGYYKQITALPVKTYFRDRLSPVLFIGENIEGAVMPMRTS